MILLTPYKRHKKDVVISMTRNLFVRQLYNVQRKAMDSAKVFPAGTAHRDITAAHFGVWNVIF
jgi:hypothetical protein